MKLVWCPDTASKAYIDGVRAIANDDTASDGSPELAELLAAMAGGWNTQLIVDAPSSPSTTSRRPPATSLALAAAARRTGGRYSSLDVEAPPEDSADDSGTSSYSFPAEAAMARLDGVDLLVLDARRSDAAAVLRAARPGARGMVVVRHGDTPGGVRRRAAPPPWGTMMAAGTRVVRAAYLPIGAGGVEVLHVGVGKGPSLQLPTTTTTQQSRRPGEEHVIRQGFVMLTTVPARSTSSGASSRHLHLQLHRPW